MHKRNVGDITIIKRSVHIVSSAVLHHSPLFKGTSQILHKGKKFRLIPNSLRITLGVSGGRISDRGVRSVR